MSSFLNQALTPRRYAAGNIMDPRFWSVGEGGMAASGVNVTADSAMRHSVVFACVRVLSETMAGTMNEPQTGIFRWLDGRKGKELVTTHPLHRVLTFMPNRYQTAFEWVEMMTGHCALRGNAYSQILSGPRGVVDQLIPLHPDAVRPEVNNQDGMGWVDAKTATFGPKGVIRYVVTQRDGTTVNMIDDDIFHLRGMSTNGIVGISVLSAAREAIGHGLAMESYGARYFSQDASPGGVLETVQKISPETEERLDASWRRAHEGHQKSHRVAILQQGLKWQQVGMSPEDSQFVESIQANIPQIARFFRMQPHKIGDLSRSTFSNIEHQGLEFSNDTIEPWAKRFEQAYRRDLIVADDRYFFKFDLSKLTQGTRLERLQAHAIGLNWGVQSPDEVRADLNLNPRGDADGGRYYRPLNMVLAGEEMPMEKRVEAAGRLVSSGYLPADALDAVGLPQLAHLGLPPVTVQPPQKSPAVPAEVAPEEPDAMPNPTPGQMKFRSGEPEPQPPAKEPPPAEPKATPPEPPASTKAAGPGPAVLATAENLHTQEVRWVETWAPRLAKDPPAWRRKAAEFYEAHAERITRRLGVSGVAYCAGHRSRLTSEGVAVIGEWGPAELVALLEES